MKCPNCKTNNDEIYCQNCDDGERMTELGKELQDNFFKNYPKEFQDLEDEISSLVNTHPREEKNEN